jgi:hypothetical protein
MPSNSDWGKNYIPGDWKITTSKNANNSITWTDWQESISLNEETLRRAVDTLRDPDSRRPTGGATLDLIKQSIRQIKAGAVGKTAQRRVETKAERLRRLGLECQAIIVETELSLRIKLARIQEWDYKVLPYEAIKNYERNGRNWDGHGGRIVVHIDALDKYTGFMQGEVVSSDRIVPDFVLDKLEEATERQVFDEFRVLWVEKVKDPLLLGTIQGCQDYFLICEWGQDVSFDDIMKGKKK